MGIACCVGGYTAHERILSPMGLGWLASSYEDRETHKPAVTSRSVP